MVHQQKQGGKGQLFGVRRLGGAFEFHPRERLSKRKRRQAAALQILRLRLSRA